MKVYEKVHSPECQTMLAPGPCGSWSKPGLFRISIFWRWMLPSAGAKLIEDVEEALGDLLAIEQVREVCTVHTGPTCR